MAFARAFSTKRNKPDMEISTPSFLSRATSQRAGKPIFRGQISSPMALVSTSNRHVRDAQAIAGTTPIEIRNISSSSSVSSAGEDSDTSTGSVHSSGTITDASSVDWSPIGPEPEPNHLTAYFKPAVETNSRSKTEIPSPTDSVHSSLDTPKIPQRAASHSKKAHEGLHRKRSIQRMLSPPPNRERDIARSSTEMFHQSPTFVETPKESPFGKELRQLDEVTEEYGQVVRKTAIDEDALYMSSRGLAFFTASDYMYEIQSFVHTMFADEKPKLPDYVGFF